MKPSRTFWSGKTVCVTGGTGFVGFQIVRQLVGAGALVRCLALRPADTHPIFALERVERHFGDVCDTQFVRTVLSGCDVVFHTAGIVSIWGPGLSRMHEIHVAGTRSVLAAAPPQARVVHTSSIVTIGASDGRPLTEDDTWNLRGLQVEYVQAKRAAEELALAEAARGRDVVVVNPGLLIGPEDYEGSFMGRFCLRFWKGRIFLAPSGGANLVDVRDVAVGHLLAAERGRSGRRYIMGGENVSLPALMRTMASVANMRPRAMVRMPHWFEWVVATGEEFRAVFHRREPYPSFQHVRLNRLTWFYDWTRAREELEFQPRPVLESLRDTFEWHAARQSIQPRGIYRFWMRPKGP
ncbi:MAG TPA: NAD-dependent epimerase/dehydratase family protein [Candidatus Methylomirabilis sp.]|nr:NAD-dependent epimerase/dehydratase family protein [Candidatus Methylomirabilis sp.]